MRRRLMHWLRAAVLVLPFAALPMTAPAQTAAPAAAGTAAGIPLPEPLNGALQAETLDLLGADRGDAASDALKREIALEPQNAGAWLDLAITQCQLGRAAEAERLFVAIEQRFSPPPAIRQVIAAQRAKGCIGRQPRDRLSVRLSRGYDTNVNQGASDPDFTINSGGQLINVELLPEYLPQSDHFTVLAGEYVRPLRVDGQSVFALFRAAANDRVKRFSTISAIGGYEHPWRAGAWDWRGSGVASVQGLGGRLYQAQAQLQLSATPPLPLPAPWRLALQTGLAHAHYFTLQNFDSTTLELRTFLRYQSNRTQAAASFAYLTDRADSGRPGGNREGWSMGLQGQTSFLDTVVGELGWTYQTWQSRNAYSPGLIDVRRHQRTQLLRGALAVPLGGRHSVHLELRHLDNRENISLFRYRSRQVQLGWQWLFP